MAAKKKIAVYGAGGFAREVAWLLSKHQNYDIYDMIGFIEDDMGDKLVTHSTNPFYVHHMLFALDYLIEVGTSIRPKFCCA